MTLTHETAYETIDFRFGAAEERIMARTWVCPMMRSERIKPAVAVLEAAGYVRDGSGRTGTYSSEEEPMYRDGGYIADLLVCEDPSRPVIDQLHAMLTPDAKVPPP